MSHEEYSRKRDWLLEVLNDAIDRGDYYLEMDVKENLSNLNDAYNSED